MEIRPFFSSGRSIIRLSVPIILAQMGNVLLGLTDTIMLGQYGKAELAAVGFANQIFFLIVSVGLGIMTALTSLIASSKGAENAKQCGEFLRSGIEVSLIIGTGLMITIMVVSLNLGLFGQTEVVNDIGGKYLRIIGVSVFPMLLFLALKHFSDGLSYSKPAMLITFIGVVLNIFLNWVFIYGSLTFPSLGATGAGIATLITRFIMAFLLVLVIFNSSFLRVYLPPLVSTYKTKPIIIKLFRLGLPTGIQLFFEVAGYAVSTIMAGWIGLTALAAHQIGMGIVALSYVISTGLCVAVSIQIGHAYGKRNFEAIKTRGFSSLSVSLIFMGTTSIFLFILQEPVIRLFSLEEDVLMYAKSIFILLIVYQFINGVQATLVGILRGIHDVDFPAAFTLGAYCLFALPVSYILVVKYDFSLPGIWIALLGGVILSSSAFIIRFISSLIKRKIKNYESDILESV